MEWKWGVGTIKGLPRSLYIQEAEYYRRKDAHSEPDMVEGWVEIMERDSVRDYFEELE